MTERDTTTAATRAKEDNGLEIEMMDLTSQPQRREPKPSPEIQALRERLVESDRLRREAQAQILDGPAVARIAGRVARLDIRGLDAKRADMWLAVKDGENEERYQGIRVRVSLDLVGFVFEGSNIVVTCTWQYGRLTATEFELNEISDEPMPEVRLPEPKAKALTNTNDGHLPTMAELDKDAREGGWGSLNHSRYRATMAWHLTTSPKCRAKSFEGQAPMVQAILRSVAEAEGLNVIAIAAEPDHIHLLGLPAGPGGMAPTWQWSRWIGRWKALTSKRLKALPGLEDFQWQVGFALTSVNGGKQGAEEALEVVKRYVESQGHQVMGGGSSDDANLSEDDGERD